MKPPRNVSMVVLAALAVLTLAGCSEQEVYGQLGERQANEMVAVLRQAGLAADKHAAENHQFSVSTSSGDFSRAIELLNAAGYPRSDYDTLGQVFKKEGFVSSPLEERARLLHALSQEMASTLHHIDGVVVARVHLAVPEKDPLSERTKPAAASVFIKHRAGVDLNPRIGQIKALVVNSIEGLPYDNVSVVLFAAEPLPTPPVPARAALAGIDGPLLAAASLGGAALVAGGAMWGWQRRRPVRNALTVLARGSAKPAGEP